MKDEIHFHKSQRPEWELQVEPAGETLMSTFSRLLGQLGGKPGSYKIFLPHKHGEQFSLNSAAHEV